uniref:Uncharacterized protein LOC111134255 isoform X1 n=1 Tax=Crassostrea virginica TaxID=6565 RepID=A0A8B8EDW2_CRAVI|nr:uncharacterized protein LOC111134255 isoform X1 [Crassostrea virginica]
MDDYQTHIHHQTCSFPDCCKDIFISEPEIINVTRIELNACSTQLNEQNYRITSTKGTSWTLRSKKCCNGVIYVYFATSTVTTATSRGETSFLPQKTATSAVPPLTSFGAPRIPSTEPGNNGTSALIIGLVCAVLLCVLCFCACTYRRYRKTKMAMGKKNQIQPLCEYLYSVVEEFQGIEAVDNTISNYFVLEARNDSNVTTNTNFLPTSVKDQSSSEYESIANLPNIEDDRKDIQDGVYNTLREHEALSNDPMDNYSHFQDFNQDYNFLSR